MASQHLGRVCGAAINHDLLYACVLDSQQAGDKLCAVTALKKLVGQYQYKAPSPIHLPALLRCTIRLLYAVLEDSEVLVDKEVIVQDLCEVFTGGELRESRPFTEHSVDFDAAVVAINRDPKDAEGRSLFDIRELEWLCRHSYNLGLKYAGTWNLSSTIAILSSCVKTIKRFPLDIASAQVEDLCLKNLFCHFIITSALVASARAEDNVENQLQYYLRLRKHVADFDNELQLRLQDLNEKWASDMLNKLAHLLVFDFEGAIHLQKWEDLEEIVRKAEQCENVTALKAMADCILGSRAPALGPFQDDLLN